MRALLCVVALGAAAVAASAAPGADVSRAELRALADGARSDAAALERLRRVDSVGGRPMDVGAALEGAEGTDLQRRLRLLAAGGGDAAAAPSSTVRNEAREVLAERRFQPAEGLRPLRGALEWLSSGLAPILSAAGDFLERLSGWIPGGDLVLWAVAAMLVASLAGWLALRAIRNRSAAEEPAARPAATGDRLDPRRLEREADAAERRGELELAIRLRFRAGLLRLDRARRIAFRESMTSGEVARRLRSRDFDDVAAAFDEIVYGGRHPLAADVATARERWRRVLGEAA